MAIAEQELIEVQPATQLPRDARPSELVRGWPEDRWCSGGVKVANGDGVPQYCAIGILAYFGGHNGAWTTDSCRAVVSIIYGIPYGELGMVIETNDESGKDAAADVLEAAGFWVMLLFGAALWLASALLGFVLFSVTGRPDFLEAAAGFLALVLSTFILDELRGIHNELRKR